jgi:sugar phosphate isomerase/epimerase
MSPIRSETLASTRREFLTGALWGAAGMALLPVAGVGAQAAPADPYAPFRVGLQSYSLRHFGLDDALAKTQELGLHYWEAFPNHMPITADPKVIADYKAKLDAHNIQLLAYGVVDFSNDENDARQKFNFARAMNVRVLSAHPSPDSFGLLDRLVAEYNIRLAIHNHGPGDDLYDTWQKGLAAVKGHDPRIGFCDDTGHFLRSNVSPVTAAMEFGKRLYDIHLKAVKDGPNATKEFTEIGKPGSLLDVVSLFRVLQHEHYTHLIALEYEEHEEDPMPYIKECLEATRHYCDTIRNVALVEPPNKP